MSVVRDGPEFWTNVDEFIHEHKLDPRVVAKELDELKALEQFIRLDDQIYGLCVAEITAAEGREATLLAIQYAGNRHRILVRIEIRSESIASVRSSKRSASCKRLINLAVAEIIDLIIDGELHTDIGIGKLRRLVSNLFNGAKNAADSFTKPQG